MRTGAWVKGGFLLVVTFAAGVAVGVSYVGTRASQPASASMLSHDANHRWLSELDLDQVQQQKITEILARRQAEVDATWHEMQPHVRATLDSTSQEIIAVLKPEQAEKFRKLVGRMHTQHH